MRGLTKIVGYRRGFGVLNSTYFSGSIIFEWSTGEDIIGHQFSHLSSSNSINFQT